MSACFSFRPPDALQATGSACLPGTHLPEWMTGSNTLLPAGGGTQWLINGKRYALV